MAISKGMSNAMAELIFRRNALEGMINVQESHFEGVLAALRGDMAALSETLLDFDEREDALRPYYEEESRVAMELVEMRLQFFIAAYSICENAMFSILSHYNIMVSRCSQKKPIHMGDLLFTLGLCNVREAHDKAAYTVYYALRFARNCLIHPQPSRRKLRKAVLRLKARGINDVVLSDNTILFTSSKPVKQAIDICYAMLEDAEHRAQRLAHINME